MMWTKNWNIKHFYMTYFTITIVPSIHFLGDMIHDDWMSVACHFSLYLQAVCVCIFVLVSGIRAR